MEQALRLTCDTDDLPFTLEAFSVLQLQFSGVWHGKIDFDYTSFTLIDPYASTPISFTMTALHTLLLTGV